MVDVFELFRAMPDQVTSERLEEARTQVARIGEIDPSSVQEGVALAHNLQGISRAVSDIVLARGAVELTELDQAPNYNPDIMPPVFSSNILRRFADPDTRLGRMFTAQPSTGFGATIGIHEVATENQRTVYDVKIPTDEQIDTLLTDEPCFWGDVFTCARDFRSGQPNVVYPFSNRFHSEEAAGTYFSLLQELTAELLDHSDI